LIVNEKCKTDESMFHYWIVAAKRAFG